MHGTVLKRCNKCEQSKPLGDFHCESKSPDGRQYRCKTCNAAYYRNNRIHIKERETAYRQANPDVNKKRCALYRQINCEQKREKDRAYRKSNPERIRETQLRYRQANREQLNERAASRKREAIRCTDGRAQRLFQSAKSRAKMKQISFTITKEDVLKLLLAGKCQQSGVRFDLQKTALAARNPFAPSIDRKDNSKGYTAENIQIVCNVFNMGKGEHKELDFIAMCVAVAKKHQNNPVVIVRLMELGAL